MFRAARAILIGAIGVALLCAVTPYNDYQLKNTPLYGNHLPAGALFLFALLTLAINPAIKRFAARRALAPGELLLIWAMLTAGAGLASSGLWRFLGPMTVAPAYFAGSGKTWMDLFRDAPPWLLVSQNPRDPAIIAFYEGLRTGQQIPWAAWVPVTVGWGLAFACVAAFSLGMTALFRRQWVERERLSFPLVQVPLHLVSDPGGKGSLARNPLCWAGCLTVLILHGISTLHFFAPAFPGFPDETEIASLMPVRPWNAMAMPPVKVFFSIIGATYLLPGDVSLSLWLSYIGLHLVRVVRVALGADPIERGSLNHEHAMGAGAFFVIALYLFWISRPHWREIALALRSPGTIDDREEPMTARVAVGLVGIGILGLIAWLTLAGMPVLLSAGFVVLFYTLIFVLTRFVAESGLLFLDSTYMPMQVLTVNGSQAFTPLSAGLGMQTDIILVHYPTEHIMPAATNVYALPTLARRDVSSISPIRPRDFTIGMVIALLVGFFVAFIASLWVNYHHGAIRLDAYGATEAPNWSLDRAEEYIRSPQAFPRDLYAMGIGAAVAALFLYLRTHYLWWSIGPIGLAMAPSWAMDHMYFSIFMGWLCRVILLFLGGLRLYRSALPYFLGLLLGEGLFSGIAVLWGLATGINAPPFFPAS